MDCHGENPADRENMGPLVYHPDQGLSKNYYPYKNQAGYVSPAIFVEFANPQREKNSAFSFNIYLFLKRE